MRARLATAAIGIPALAGLISFAPPSAFAVAVAALVAIGLFELATLARAQGIDSYPWLASATAVVLTLEPAIYTELHVTLDPSTILTIALFACFLRGVSAAHPLPNLLPGIGVAIVGVVWIGLLGSYLVRIRALSYGSRYIYLLLAIVWGADAGALFVGRRFGKHRLAPTVSPGKTIEGLVGGVTFAIVGALAVRAAAGLTAALPLAATVGLAVLVAIAGVAGDLAESAIKRGAAVKDSGSIFPGHGGALDRLDSLLFAAPVMYYGLRLFAH